MSVVSHCFLFPSPSNDGSEQWRRRKWGHRHFSLKHPHQLTCNTSAHTAGTRLMYTGLDGRLCVYSCIDLGARIYGMLCKKKKKSVKCAHPQMSEGVSNMGVGKRRRGRGELWWDMAAVLRHSRPLSRCCVCVCVCVCVWWIVFMRRLDELTVTPLTALIRSHRRHVGLFSCSGVPGSRGGGREVEFCRRSTRPDAHQSIKLWRYVSRSRCPRDMFSA